MPKEQSLSDFFINQKIPVSERYGIPLISKGHVLWVMGIRVSEYARVLNSGKHYMAILSFKVLRDSFFTSCYNYSMKFIISVVFLSLLFLFQSDIAAKNT